MDTERHTQERCIFYNVLDTVGESNLADFFFIILLKIHYFFLMYIDASEKTCYYQSIKRRE